LIIFAANLSVILKAHPTAFIILGASLFISIISTVVRSYLLAFQHLVAQIVIGFIEIISTLGLAYVFIILGLSATGAVLAQIVAGIIGVIISFQVIKKKVLPPVLSSKRSFSLRSFIPNCQTSSSSWIRLIFSNNCFSKLREVPHPERYA